MLTGFSSPSLYTERELEGEVSPFLKGRDRGIIKELELCMRARVKRKPGAQPGNQNARKHGFYSKSLTPEQQKVLSGAARIKGLNREVAVLRVKIASILKNDPQNLAVLFQAVSTLGRTLRNRQSLVHTHRQFVSWLNAENDSSVK
jgi:hypothetical protein